REHELFRLLDPDRPGDRRLGSADASRTGGPRRRRTGGRPVGENQRPRAGRQLRVDSPVHALGLSFQQSRPPGAGLCSPARPRGGRGVLAVVLGAWLCSPARRQGGPRGGGRRVMTKALITGASGFIGSNLTEALA